MTMHLLSGAPSDLRTVRATLDAAPLAVTPTGAGDALNPASWTVGRSDTGPLTVVAVDRVLAAVFDVHTLEPLGSHLVRHALGIVGMSIAGSPVTETIGFMGEAWAATFTPEGQIAAQRKTSRDLANPPVGILGSDAGGTLVVQGGDYATVTGADLVRKLYARRLTTAPGGFFHLPDYGLGLSAKEPAPFSDLARYKAEVERQLREEPETAAVIAKLRLTPTGDGAVLSVTIAATLRPTGDQIAVDVSQAVPGSNVVF
jgi:hypothetical protein